MRQTQRGKAAVVMPMVFFRVFPEPRTTPYGSRRSRLYWLVNVYRTKAQMRKGYRTWMTGLKCIGTRRVDGLTTQRRWVKFVGKRTVTHPCLGWIFLHGRPGATIISHEAVHAAKGYFERKRLKVDDEKNDERFAYAVSETVRQICGRIW